MELISDSKQLGLFGNKPFLKLCLFFLSDQVSLRGGEIVVHSNGGGMGWGGVREEGKIREGHMSQL